MSKTDFYDASGADTSRIGAHRLHIVGTCIYLHIHVYDVYVYAYAYNPEGTKGTDRGRHREALTPFCVVIISLPGFMGPNCSLWHSEPQSMIGSSFFQKTAK